VTPTVRYRSKRWKSRGSRRTLPCSVDRVSKPSPTSAWPSRRRSDACAYWRKSL
jgi:hypothetical protein